MTAIFTPSTLADRWQCSERHIRNLISAGNLPAFAVGKLLRITRKAVEEYECQNGGSLASAANSASHGTSLAESAGDIVLELPIRKRRTPAQRLDLQN